MNDINNSMEKPARLFIAVESDAETQRRIATLQQKLACSGADVKWVKPENAHITLVFFGDTPAGEAEQIKSHMNETMRDFTPFQILLRGAGWFGTSKHPRVVWIGAIDPERKLERLQLKLRETLRSLVPGKEAGRDFSPHLTLGRPRSSRNALELVAAITKNADFHIGNLHVNKIVLMRSELTPAGPCYIPMHTAQ